MSQAAALYIASQEFVDNASTYGARSYYLGMRDAFEAVFRACHKVSDELASNIAAGQLLGDLDHYTREALLTTARATLKDRRAETVKETVSAV